MEHYVMDRDEQPEVHLGTGKSQISLKGKEAIRAAGWALRLLLLARAVRNLLVLPIGGYFLLRWLLSG
jgi:hypothetical protein